jgi:hypothetical protein
MVQKSFGNSGKNLSNEYHKQRRIATFEVFSIDEFSDLDIERYDLDEITPRRGAKRSSYITETRLDVEGGSKSDVNIKTLDNRD